MNGYGEPWRACNGNYEHDPDVACICGMVWDNTGNTCVARAGMSDEPWSPTREQAERNGKRIAECINACSGVTFNGDPTGAVRELVEAAEAFANDSYRATRFETQEAVLKVLARFEVES